MRPGGGTDGGGDARAGRGGSLRVQRGGLHAGLTLRALVPNAITAAALCVGLTGIRFAIASNFDRAVLAVLLAGVLDGLDGRMARLLKAQSRFGAELDSLADAISFGVAPALIVYLWSLQTLPRLGWLAALGYAICCVLRLARFNARIDLPDQPHKQAGYLTGVPAPLGAMLAFLPLCLWIASDWQTLRHPVVVTVWMVLVAFLMISSVPTLSWAKLRPRRTVRLELIALVGMLVATMLTEPWLTLVVVTAGYLLTIPFSMLTYARLRRGQVPGERTRQIPASPPAPPSTPA